MTGRHKSLIGALLFLGSAISVCAYASRSFARSVCAVLDTDRSDGIWEDCNTGGSLVAWAVPFDVGGRPHWDQAAGAFNGSTITTAVNFQPLGWEIRLAPNNNVDAFYDHEDTWWPSSGQNTNQTVNVGVNVAFNFQGPCTVHYFTAFGCANGP
jgi:hypothetical protein